MKFSIIAAALVGTAAAFPSMTELKAAVSKRQFSGSTELLGDLATLKDSELTTAGKDIKAILLGRGDGQSTADYYKAPPAYDSAECKQDECCVWHYVAEELYGLMHDAATGTCTDFARASIRMGFHDAAAWNKQSSWGGADGSLLLSSDELSRPENAALNPAGARMKAIFARYSPRGISMADLLQVGAKVGVLACPGGPRIRTFVGRPDDATPAPAGLLPPAFFTADQILDLFADKTVGPGGLVALIGAHTASRNHTAAAPGAPAPPQDRTPGKWDTEYFDEHLRANASAGLFRFPSDVSLARSPKTKPVFQQFSAQKGAWDEAYAREYIRMSLMGVKKINRLRECTRALPGKGDKPEPPVSVPSSSSLAKPSSSTTTATAASYKPTALTFYQSTTVTVVSCAPGVKCNGGGGGGEHPHSGPTAAPTSSTPASGAHGGHPIPTTTTSVPTRGAVVTAGSPRVSAGWVAAAMGAAVALL